MGATPLTDHAGTPIVLGAAVKVNATVTGINQFDPHYGELEITLAFPGAVPQNNVQVIGNNIVAGQLAPTLYPTKVHVSPTMVTVGT